MKVGSLFAGIGGIDLGLERAGMEIAWQCENDKYARLVLNKHWPSIPCYPDIREIDFSDVPAVDMICGGFPCQDLSLAGKRAGLDGERSGLFYEMLRAIRELRPRYALLENVPGLLSGGMGTVLGELAAIGYDAEWESLPAAAFGAPHLRYRVFIVAYTHGNGQRATEGGEALADTDEERRNRGAGVFGPGRGAEPENRSEALADTDRKRREYPPQRQEALPVFGSRRAPRADWAPEPDVGRVADGVPHRVDRLRCLGNAVVPQVAEWIGIQILEREKRRHGETQM